MKILVVDDEEKLVEPIKDRLEQEGYAVDYALDGLDGFYQAKSGIYDLIILDVMLPYKDGFTVLSELRKDNVKTPIIMLTAKTTLEDKLAGFQNGADDYLSKPFHLEELVARVNAKLKNNIQDMDCLTYGDIELDLHYKRLLCTKNHETVDLRCKEFLLMECLLEHQDQVVSKKYLHNTVWGVDNVSISNNLEAYISFLRKKLSTIESKVAIKAVRGLGYKLEITHA